MLQYVNGFTCSLSETKDTLVIHFLQNEPIVPDDTNLRVKMATHNVSSIVMDRNCATGLMSSLANLFASPEKNTEES